MRTPLVASSKSSATSFRLTAEHPGGLIRCARMTGAFGLSVCCKFSEAPRAGVSVQSSLELARRSIRRLPLDIFRGCCASMCVTTSLHHVCVKGLHASIGTTLCCRAGSSGSPVAATWRATGWRTRSTGRSLSAPPPSGPATGTSGATGAPTVRLVLLESEPGAKALASVLIVATPPVVSVCPVVHDRDSPTEHCLMTWHPGAM